MAALNEENVRHLLRRTEFVDRPDRVDDLLALSSIEDAVDNVMDIGGAPSASFSGIPEDQDWQRGIHMTEHWLDRMATANRPFGERMGFFWHGHICSGLDKVSNAVAMQEQIDLFRNRGLGPASNGGNVSDLAITMSTQVAMLQYLDNDQNSAESPNQNFARELMELFLLGVGNYTEADVEAATAAWTGHTVDYPTQQYQYLSQYHETAPQSFLGRTINSGSRPLRQAGAETIEVILGTGPLGAGTVPNGAATNGGRSTAAVAAEFLSKKLWQEFGEAATGSVPNGVLSEMRSALLDNDFDIRPWVRAMLVHDDFYTPTAKAGLVRQPVEYVVALMIATGLTAEEAAPHWLMDRAGQQLLFPPNVSGWKPNGYWINASAMGARQRIAQVAVWSLTSDERDNGEGMQLAHGYIDYEWLREPSRSGAQVVDAFLEATALDTRLSAGTRQAIIDHLDDPIINYWQRIDALLLALYAPEMHVA